MAYQGVQALQQGSSADAGSQPALAQAPDEWLPGTMYRLLGRLGGWRGRRALFSWS